MKKLVLSFACAAMVLTSCGNLSNLVKGTAVGGGAGAAIGAAAGALIGDSGKSAAIGAAIGAVVGSSAGAIIGNKMDKKAEELAAIEGAKIDTLSDANDLKSIRVTFDSGILFATNKADLSKDSKSALKEFAKTMSDMPDTKLYIQGHTDNTGARALNEDLSLRRAQSVADYLKSEGMDVDRFTVEGKAWDVPVASNETVEGRAQNRRVEIYITADENMIKEAEAEAASAK